MTAAIPERAAFDISSGFLKVKRKFVCTIYLEFIVAMHYFTHVIFLPDNNLVFLARSIMYLIYGM